FPEAEATAIVADSAFHAPSGSRQGTAVRVPGGNHPRHLLLTRCTTDGVWTYGVDVEGAGFVATNNWIESDLYAVDVSRLGSHLTSCLFINNVLMSPTAVRISGPAAA